LRIHVGAAQGFGGEGGGVGHGEFAGWVGLFRLHPHGSHNPEIRRFERR
jgi:hypothetical protein